MSKIEVILTHPHREEAAMSRYPSNDVSDIKARSEFLGPVFVDCKATVKDGVLTVVTDTGTYVYPLHTIARIKETK